MTRKSDHEHETAFPIYSRATRLISVALPFLQLIQFLSLSLSLFQWPGDDLQAQIRAHDRLRVFHTKQKSARECQSRTLPWQNLFAKTFQELETRTDRPCFVSSTQDVISLEPFRCGRLRQSRTDLHLEKRGISAEGTTSGPGGSSNTHEIGSEERDQTELAIPTQKNTSRRAQASPSYHRVRRGEKMSSDEDDAEMCTGRMPAPPTHEHGRNESSMSLPQEKPSSVQTRGKNWTNPEDKLLIQAHGAPYRRKRESWTDIASNIPGRTGDQCRLRWDTLLRNYRKEHHKQGKSEEEYFQDLLSGRISCGQGESSQRDHLQEQEGKSWKKRKTLESDVAQDCHCKRERLFEVHETTSILQLAQRILKIQERFLELKELKYERKTSGAEQATSQGDGLRAAEVGTTHWSSGQTNFVLPFHQEPVGQLFGAFPFVDCEGVPQSNFNGIQKF